MLNRHWGQHPFSIVSNSVINVKALLGLGAFNQEKALVGAFSVIVKTDCGTDGPICGTSGDPVVTTWQLMAPLSLPRHAAAAGPS